jgi:molybdopterin synthase sulfur carrier subunit
MSIRILYFAGLREALKLSGESMALPPEVASVGALREFLASRGADWQALQSMRNLRYAVNQAMVGAEAPVADGDEIAFFPPVTGG